MYFFSSFCKCGSNNITSGESYDFSCCSSSPCHKLSDGHVTCEDGQKQEWNKPCGERCIQRARYGDNLQLCKIDQDECVMEAFSCRGRAQCSE